MALITIFINRDFYHDDAYITLRYARNHLAGVGIVWNSGEYVQGYTNFLHLILISLLGRLNVDLVLASRIVGLISIVGLVSVIFGFRAKINGRHDGMLGYLPTILVATSTPILVWSIGGLEGTLFSLMTTTGCLLLLTATDDPDNRYSLYAASGITLGISFLVRPDAFIFIAISGLWLFWKMVTSVKRNYFCLLAFATGVLIVAAPYIVWQFAYYGDIIPNTYYAKTGAPLGLRLISGLQYVVQYAVRPPFLLLVLLSSIAYALSKRPIWCSHFTYLLASIIAYILFVVLAGGDHMQSFRLMLPVIPLISVLLTMVISASAERHNERMVRWIVLVVILGSSLQLLDSAVNPRAEDPASRFGTMVGKYIEEAWPPGSIVASNNAGSIPYYASRHRFIDMLGLNDPVIAKRTIIKPELPWQFRPGHLKGDGRYVLTRRPDFIILGPPEGTDVSRPWFLSDLEISRESDFAENYAREHVFLNTNGQEVEAGGFMFVYYRRIRNGLASWSLPRGVSQRHFSADRPYPDNH